MRCRLKTVVVIAALSILIGAAERASADQPLLGFSGTLVRLPAKYNFGNGIRGMRVNSVEWFSPAARMGLERGDIVVTVDNVAFKSRAGYLAALRMSSQKPSLIVVNVRNGRLTRVSASLPHRRDNRKHPDTVGLAIDLRRDMRN